MGKHDSPGCVRLSGYRRYPSGEGQRVGVGAETVNIQRLGEI